MGSRKGDSTRKLRAGDRNTPLDVPLTDKQKEILDYIRRFIEDNGYPPTFSNIGENFGITQPAAYFACNYICRKGYLKITPGISRGMALTDKEIK